MDPFTIPTGVLACISVCLQVLVGLKQLKANADGGSIGSASIDVLASDISGLRQVLQSMEEAYQDVEDDWARRETGHAATHWRDLCQCLNDVHRVLSDFVVMLFDLNKKVKTLAPSRMESRLQSAAVRFALVGQQVQAYRDAFQVSLEVLILSNSVSLQNPTPKLESTAMNQDIRRLMARVDIKIQAVEDAITRNTDTKTVDAVAMLKQCVASAVSLFSSAPTPTPTVRQSKSTGPLLSSNRHDGVMKWINNSSLDAVRLQTPPLEDSSFERASPQTTTTQVPAKKVAHSAAVLKAPPLPAASLPSPASSPADAHKPPVSRRNLARLHPHHRLPPQQHPVPEPLFMYMVPVDWQGQKKNHPHTPTSPAFPVQVIFGPPPALCHQRRSLQRPLVPFGPAPPSSNPTSQHSRWPTVSSASASSLHSQAQPRQQPQLQPAVQPPPKVQPKRQLRTQQLPPTHARVRLQLPSMPRAGPSYGNSDNVSESRPAAKQKLSKLQKQPRGSGKAVVEPEKGDKQQPGLVENDVKNGISIGQPPSAKRKSQNPFSALRKLMPGSVENLPRRQKFCFVGDSGCGKTCLLTAMTKGTSPEVYEPTTFEKYESGVEVRGVGRIELEIWDTAGCEVHDSLRSLAYPDSHAIVLCFSIGDPSSYHNVLEKWLPEATRFSPETPIFVVGCKKDLRFDGQTIGELQRSGQLPLITAEGLAVAGRINARYYIETSAKISYGIENVLTIMAEEILKTPRSESLIKVGKRFHEDARLINEERRNLRASGEILTPREWEYASKYVQLLDEPDSTVWKLREEQIVVNKGINSSRSSFFRKSS